MGAVKLLLEIRSARCIPAWGSSLRERNTVNIVVNERGRVRLNRMTMDRFFKIGLGIYGNSLGTFLCPLVLSTAGLIL